VIGQLHAAARLVLGLRPRDHIKPALFELHWLPVHLRIDHKLCLLMHSVTVQCCPRYISDIVQTTAASSRRQRLRSSTDTSSYTVPMNYTKFGQRVFSVARRSVWNSVPADIRHITGISIFKRHLNTHIFMAALCNRVGHYIFILRFFLLSICLFIFFYFPRLISAVADWMSAILPHMV